MTASNETQLHILLVFFIACCGLCRECRRSQLHGCFRQLEGDLRAKLHATARPQTPFYQYPSLWSFASCWALQRGELLSQQEMKIHEVQKQLFLIGGILQKTEMFWPLRRESHLGDQISFAIKSCHHLSCYSCWLLIGFLISAIVIVDSWLAFWNHDPTEYDTKILLNFMPTNEQYERGKIRCIEFLLSESSSYRISICAETKFDASNFCSKATMIVWNFELPYIWINNLSPMMLNDFDV